MPYTDGPVKSELQSDAMNNETRPATGWIQPARLNQLANSQPPGKVREALLLAAKEITSQRGYVDQLHAQLDAR